ncbi:MAG: hypothetical protein GX875_03070 [Propionibacterium sp.]|nr:hypothetical protein [Propionibacterium sp.]
MRRPTGARTDMLTALCALDAKLNPFTPDEIHVDAGSCYRKAQQLPKSTGQPTAATEKHSGYRKVQRLPKGTGQPAAATEERSGYRMFGSRCNYR